jgi:hypothetical protein
MEGNKLVTLTKKQERYILKYVRKAISLATDDVGLDEQFYGILEDRIEWYLEFMKYEIGYELEIKFHHEEYLVKIVECREISEEENRLAQNVPQNYRKWRMPKM